MSIYTGLSKRKRSAEECGPTRGGREKFQASCTSWHGPEMFVRHICLPEWLGSILVHHKRDVS
jgi:hypothetical protein